MLRLLSTVCLLATPLAAHAAVPGASVAEALPIDWVVVWMTLLGGLALFLAGMEMMSDALKLAAGGGLRVVLGRMTSNRFLGALSGAVITAILNSSSITTVLVVGFISAGLMSLAQAVGIIMGANIGSTVAAQIIAFNVTQYALLPVAVGFFVRFASKADRARNVGGIVMGLGLVFFGMGLMGQAMEPLRAYPPFLEWIQGMSNPLLGIAVGAVFTALIQSSAATTGIAIAMASGGLVTLEAGVALALGANVGTCITAVLAAIGKPRAAVRAAVVHVLFNVIGVLIWIFFIPELCQMVRYISPTAVGLSGSERLAADVPRQIANAHTLFNLVNTVLFIGFTGTFATLATRLVPERPEAEPPTIRPRFLDPQLAATPTLAMGRVRLELGHMGEHVDAMFAAYKETFSGEGPPERAEIERIVRMDDAVDVLAARILGYLASLPRESIQEDDSRELLKLMTATDTIESIADMLEGDLTQILRDLADHRVQPSETMVELMQHFFDTVRESVRLALRSLVERDEAAARDVLAMKVAIAESMNRALAHQADKLRPESEDRIRVFRLEMGFIDAMKQLYSLAKRMARLELPAELQSATVRH